MQEIPPFETKSIMKASFLGRIEHNHTAFIRIKTNKDNKQELLILPVEVEVTSGELFPLSSFIQAISIAPLQVHYYSEALPTQHGYCVTLLRLHLHPYQQNQQSINFRLIGTNS